MYIYVCHASTKTEKYQYYYFLQIHNDITVRCALSTDHSSVVIVSDCELTIKLIHL